VRPTLHEVSSDTSEELEAPGGPHITSIAAFGLRGATSKGGWSRELSPNDNVHTLVIVDTDDEIQGVGSVFTTAELVRASLRTLEPLYLGESALEPERLAESAHQHTFWQGRGGAITHTISGIDLALWDIVGKRQHQPVGRLLGGRCRDTVVPYASTLISEPTRLRDELAELRAAGFRAFKIGWGGFGRRDATFDQRVVAAAREAVGDECALAVDAGGSDAYWDGRLNWALRTAHMLADHGIEWFEEPLQPDDLDGYAELRRLSPVPIAGGEVLTRRQAFLPYLAARALDIVQPDVTKVGGLSEQRRIGWMAEDHHVRLYPHGWNTAIGLAADLQLASVLPSTRYVEYRPGSAYIDELVDTPWALAKDGTLSIPATPGLGISLDPDAVARYADAPVPEHMTTRRTQ
jgi:D-galactarolactone cycloisomerase